MLQLRQALAPDGLFLATMLGGETLTELRQVLLQAESEVTGGAVPRVSPSADLRDMAGLLQRAGFVMPVADNDQLIVTYPDLSTLFRDLRGMGATSVLHAGRGHPLTRSDPAARRRTLPAAVQRKRSPAGDVRIPQPGRLDSRMTVTILPALEDNYIYVLESGSAVADCRSR